MLPFYVKDPRLREGDKCNKNESGNVQNLRKTLAFFVHKVDNSTKATSCQVSYSEGDDGKKKEGNDVQNLRKTLAFARVTKV